MQGGSGLLWDDVLGHVVLALQGGIGKPAVLRTASFWKSLLMFWLLQWQRTAAMLGTLPARKYHEITPSHDNVFFVQFRPHTGYLVMSENEKANQTEQGLLPKLHLQGP